ncbi:helix-turn-helix domain-containing protein [Micromonospora sp. NBC_00858]|uniref:AraC-like ligand-binding domain-containing protein n=1 Tax=Micromonospora sp. NBC_00858 TaxID=2975979 RepID=UPI003868D594|nr:helix-turn-helix domain-containing protein [Micromonospora sp. NBC_00858]
MTSSVVELWRQSLGQTFGRLTPDHADEPTGTMSGTALGPLIAYQISGSPQTLRRTPLAARQEPIDRLKLCMQLDGAATVTQHGQQVHIGPGQMALYDTGHPYDLRLERQWSCAVLAFPRGALSLPDNVVRQAMQHAHPFGAGPGAVLADFVAAAVGERTSIGAAAGRLGEAGLHIIAGALSMTEPADGEAVVDAQRLRILHYAREHLSDSGLTHNRIAAVHRMAPRTLHRLFEHELYTVTEYIRLRRLESAHRDLTDPMLSHLSIARVAVRWCFISQAHFTRAFRAQYGVLPSAVRRAASPRAS